MIKQYTHHFLQTAHSLKKELLIVLVCNVDGLTEDEDNYEGDSITSEYLTLKQYNKILSALRQEGYETVSYFDENKFMQDVRSVYKELHADHETGAADNKTG